VCSTTFAGLGHAQARALGHPELPIAIIPHPFGTRTRSEIRELASACADDIARLLCAKIENGKAREARPAPPARAALVEVPDDLEAVNRLYREREWSDGLPIVPPTEARVARMLSAIKRAPEEIVAQIAPSFGAATIEHIAINAVIAGCVPGHLPLLIAATEAIAAPQFNLQVVQTTTHPVAVMLFVNGPIAKHLDIASGANCLGPGPHANGMLGRAMRLIQQNIGGALPGKTDRATQGQPGKYSFCCAENEDDSPWAPLHVERGYGRGRSTVTVVGAAGTSNMITHARDADDLIKVIAGTMNVPATLEYIYAGEPWILLAPEHARVFADANLSKDEVKGRIWAASKLRAGAMAAKDLGRARNGRSAELGDIGPDTELPVSVAPEDITLVVAGGPGTHSVFVPVFATSRSVTREVV
jgi:hypothetical protein